MAPPAPGAPAEGAGPHLRRRPRRPASPLRSRDPRHALRRHPRDLGRRRHGRGKRQDAARRLHRPHASGGRALSRHSRAGIHRRARVARARSAGGVDPRSPGPAPVRTASGGGGSDRRHHRRWLSASPPLPRPRPPRSRPGRASPHEPGAPPRRPFPRVLGTRRRPRGRDPHHGAGAVDGRTLPLRRPTPGPLRESGPRYPGGDGRVRARAPRGRERGSTRLVGVAGPPARLDRNHEAQSLLRAGRRRVRVGSGAARAERSRDPVAAGADGRDPGRGAGGRAHHTQGPLPTPPALRPGPADLGSPRDSHMEGRLGRRETPDSRCGIGSERP